MSETCEKAQHPKPWTKGQRRRLHTAEAHLELLEQAQTKLKSLEQIQTDIENLIVENRGLTESLDKMQEQQQSTNEVIAALTKRLCEEEVSTGETLRANGACIEALTEKLAKLEVAVWAPATSYPAAVVNSEPPKKVDFDSDIEGISIGAFDEDGKLLPPETV